MPVGTSGDKVKGPFLLIFYELLIRRYSGRPALPSCVAGQLSHELSVYAWPSSARRPSNPSGARPWTPWQPLPSPTRSSAHAAALHACMILKQGSEPSDLALPMLAAGLIRDFPRSSDLIHTHTERYDAVLSCTAPTTQHGSLRGRAVLRLPFSKKGRSAARRTATRAHHRARGHNVSVVPAPPITQAARVSPHELAVACIGRASRLRDTKRPEAAPARSPMSEAVDRPLSARTQAAGAALDAP